MLLRSGSLSFLQCSEFPRRPLLELQPATYIGPALSPKQKARVPVRTPAFALASVLVGHRGRSTSGPSSPGRTSAPLG